MNRKIAKLTAAETRSIDEKLLRGVVSRASTLSFIFAAAFSIYSFTSLDFLRGFEPTLSLWSNTWPRLLFNGLPLLGLGIYFRSYKEDPRIKSWIWVVSLPLVFLAACLIHVWPIIWNGQPEVYFFVHSANVFILTTALIVVAPPPRLILAQSIGFFVAVAGPVAFLFLRLGSMKMLKFELGDLLIVMPVSAYVALLIYRLRLKIALFDLELQRLAAPFLGATLTDAIYNQKSELLESRYTDAIVIQMDMRGYTEFYKNSDPVVVKKFMNAYHSLVIRFVGQYGGYWHKSVGDAHIITFGAMEAHEDLSDIPGTGKEISASTLRKKRHHFESALKSMQAINSDFNELKEKYDIDESVGLGMGVSSGEIEIRVQGDDFRKELDIDGNAVIRAARLEEYSKLIRKKVAPQSSVLVISPELAIFVEQDLAFKKWKTNNEKLQVRSFPEIESVFYHVTSQRHAGRNSKTSGAA